MQCYLAFQRLQQEESEMGKHLECYDRWARLYNRTMGPAYCSPQFNLLKRSLLPGLPPGAEILDLCCGTGQLIKPLAEAGYALTGLDLSEQMLAFARSNAPNARYIHDDVRNYQEENRYDAIFSTSASLNHLSTMDELRQVFSNAMISLRSPGRFLFDLNHPGQLAKWWQGHPTEGEITQDCAWMVTPHYEAQEQSGAFRVTMFHKPEALPSFKRLATYIKRPLYGLMSQQRFVGLRLKMLQNFNRFEPNWAREDVDFPVVGHNLSAVRSALSSIGFENVKMETIEGDQNIDDDHSAHFICEKVG